MDCFARNDAVSNGEGMHRPWCHKILGTDCGASRPKMTGGRGAGFVRLLRRYTPRNDVSIDTPHSALPRHSLPQGAREQRSVAIGNKVMDTRLPQPAGCGDKYDVSCWCWERGVSAFNSITIKAMSILSFICLLATAAEAKICFLPDGSCGTSKITGFETGGSGCQYKSKTEAEKGMGECEEAYSPDNNPCWYRRCDADNTTIFNDYASCQKGLSQKNDKDKYECSSCGSCYKLVEKTEPKVTCNETEATCSNKGRAFEANGTYDSDNVACGSCLPPEETPCDKQNSDWKVKGSCSTGEDETEVGHGSNGVCVTCRKPTQTCNDKGYRRYCDYTQDTHLLDVYGSDGQCVRCSLCASSIDVIRAYYAKNYSYDNLWHDTIPSVYYPSMRINRMTDSYVNTVKCNISSSSINGTYQGKTHFFRLYDENGTEIVQSNAQYMNGVPNASCGRNNFGYTAYFHEPDKDYCKKYTMKIFTMMPNLDIEMVKVRTLNVNYYEAVSRDYICQPADYTFAANPYKGFLNNKSYIDDDLDNFEQYVYTENGGEKIPSTMYRIASDKPYVISGAFKKSSANFSEIETPDYSQCWSGSDLKNQTFTVVEIPFTMRKGEIYGLDVVFKLKDTACVENERITFSYQNGSSIDTETMTTEEPRVYTPEIDGFETTQGTPMLYPTLGDDEACSL